MSGYGGRGAVGDRGRRVSVVARCRCGCPCPYEFQSLKLWFRVRVRVSGGDTGEGCPPFVLSVSISQIIGNPAPKGGGYGVGVAYG